ncbi:hypothetical protein I302_105336 [Kwoniella bestiolae CBS 10118]|uniref:Uncharacterized protein n=1 Tax=Kwoniella bestiolae CBS 10118 TaxID=1296100 RepID=A0A1B9FSV5_9TREE|nr:hypothetical protein I302_08622 [Kwoniella bestiolae CBS 10118]OCF21843.1 hypothetical protein I302_08622 [Kwoniella bestiolae CBS 10118]
MGQNSSKSKNRSDGVLINGDAESDRIYEITGLTGHRYPTEQEVAEELGHLKKNYLRGIMQTEINDNRDGSYNVKCHNSRAWVESEVVGLEKEFKGLSKRRSWSISLVAADGRNGCSRPAGVA